MRLQSIVDNILHDEKQLKLCNDTIKRIKHTRSQRTRAEASTLQLSSLCRGSTVTEASVISQTPVPPHKLMTSYIKEQLQYKEVFVHKQELYRENALLQRQEFETIKRRNHQIQRVKWDYIRQQKELMVAAALKRKQLKQMLRAWSSFKTLVTYLKKLLRNLVDEKETRIKKKKLIRLQHLCRLGFKNFVA